MNKAKQLYQEQKECQWLECDDCGGMVGEKGRDHAVRVGVAEAVGQPCMYHPPHVIPMSNTAFHVEALTSTTPSLNSPP